jgi:hypothetical protein
MPLSAALIDSTGPSPTKSSAAKIAHPEYTYWLPFWEKWRLCYQGTERFIDRYLERFSSRESRRDFRRRLRMTYNPAFAKSALDEIKNSIYQRISDVVRVGGPESYIRACEGDLNGVDRLGTNMNTFMGDQVLRELLSMSKVGIYVDMPTLEEDLMLDEFRSGDIRPYVYIYRVEDIRSWVPDEGNNPNEFKRLLLRETHWLFDEQFALPTDTFHRYRYLELRDIGNGERRVFATYYNEDDDGNSGEIMLDIDRIPFILLDIGESLLQEVANFQIALLNLESSDIAYCLQANYPFYTEQYDPRFEKTFAKTADDELGEQENDFGSTEITETIADIRVGLNTGRRYPIKTERPAFIHPSSEPLKASMEKEEQIKRQIRQLMHLTLTNIDPKMASAESKSLDIRGLEAGLSYIALVLQHGERKIAQYWAMYLGKSTPATVKYPERYSLESSEEKWAEVERLLKLLELTGSLLVRQTLAKRIVDIVLGCYVEYDQLQAMYAEIDRAEMILPTMQSVVDCLTAGFGSLEQAAMAYGFPAKILEQANNEHADRLARIQASQTSPDAQSRGISDKSANPNAGREEKAASRDTTKQPTPQDNTRGDGR